MPLPDDHTSEPAATHSRPSSLREARRLFAELSSPIEVDSPPGSLSDSSETHALPDQAPGRLGSRQGFPRVPGYHIERPLGEGGGGAVYLACRESSDKPIALKILNARPGEKSAQRAWRELDLLSQVHLPAVPRVLDYGRVEGGPFAGRLYIATEYIDGRPIDHHCRGVPDCKSQTANLEIASSSAPSPQHAIRTAISLLAKTADAVHALHERGIIHRDVKPANILIDRHGDPVIIDLGIATLVAADVMETLTRDGAPIGSPAYMAPEQARGDRAQISIRSDVYSLGATGFYILTGQTPHALEGATLHEAIHRIATQPARDPRQVRPDLPKPLAAILIKALSSDPKDRYDSAAAFADDLRRWTSGEPVEAGAPTPWRTATRWIARHPVAATTLLCATIVLTTIVASVAAVDVLNNRPDSIIVSPDKSKVQLLSRSGRVLHTWPNVHPNAFGRILHRPRHLGGGRIAVVFAKPPDSEGLPCQLCAFEFDDLETPIWETSSDLAIPVPGWRGDQGGGDPFSVMFVEAADVFPARDGQELLVAHATSRFPSAIRVYDLGMNVLYEAWHPGTVGELYWAPGPPGLIISTGCNNEGGEWDERVETWEREHAGRAFDWSSIGADAPIDNMWPYVVFALQPVMGENEGSGVLWGKYRDDSIISPWYRFCHPAPRSTPVPESPALANAYSIYLLPARNPAQGRTHFTLYMTSPHNPDIGFERQVEAATGRFDGAPMTADVVLEKHRDWIERFRLVDDPLTPSYTSEAAQPTGE